jgi:hypothetical protein
MVDPDEVGLVDGDGVPAPDVLGIDVRDGDVPVRVSISHPAYFLVLTE